jgi:hypothetical protein
LQKKGFTRYASLAGGMLQWNTGQHSRIGGFDYDAGL